MLHTKLLEAAYAARECGNTVKVMSDDSIMIQMPLHNMLVTTEDDDWKVSVHYLGEHKREYWVRLSKLSDIELLMNEEW